MNKSNISKSNLRKYDVKTASGLSGWRQRLQGVYSNFNEFFACCEIYSNHKKLGYASPKKAWQDNPIVEGSVLPSDYRKVAMN
jgi:hypothetical protein